MPLWKIRVNTTSPRKNNNNGDLQMEIYIRNSRLDEYKQISAIMKEVQEMDID